MISINRVRNLVMFFLEKNSRGFITPLSYDSYSDMAQRDIFENLFFQYNAWLNKKNKRLSGTEYANIPANIQEQIDVFSRYTTGADFTYDATTNLWSYVGTAEKLYRAINLAMVKTATGEKKDIELHNKLELNRMNNSSVTKPSMLFPAYERIGEDFRIFPTVPTGYSAELLYIKTPKTPRWTYTTVGGDPLYDAGSANLQDFELHEAQFVPLVQKILGYCGINLREDQIIQAAGMEQAKTNQEKQQQ